VYCLRGTEFEGDFEGSAKPHPAPWHKWALWGDQQPLAIPITAPLYGLNPTGSIATELRSDECPNTTSVRAIADVVFTGLLAANNEVP